jgi:hypothetical protein
MEHRPAQPMSERCNCTTRFISPEINLECIADRTLTDTNVCFENRLWGQKTSNDRD